MNILSRLFHRDPVKTFHQKGIVKVHCRNLSHLAEVLTSSVAFAGTMVRLTISSGGDKNDGWSWGITYTCSNTSIHIVESARSLLEKIYQTDRAPIRLESVVIMRPEVFDATAKAQKALLN